MPKRVHSASDRDDDAESTQHLNASKRARKAPELVSKACGLTRLSSITFPRPIFVKNSTMLYELTSLKTGNYSVNIFFDYRAKGWFSFLSQILTHLSFSSFSRANADYYSTIKDPIDLTQIQEKLHKNDYQTFEEFLDDLELLFNNAKTFYRVREKLFSMPERKTSPFAPVL